MSGPLRIWHHGPLDPALHQRAQRLAALDDVAVVALMPDAHLAEGVSVGTVLATRCTLLPAAVGGDAGCGVATLRFTGGAEGLDDRPLAEAVLADLCASVPILRHPRAQASPLDPGELRHPALRRFATREGPGELGTLGRGNHFVELQEDDEGALWAMVHSGSRGLGPALRDHYLHQATDLGEGLSGLDAESDLGQDYRADLDWMLRWAALNRTILLARVARVIERRLGLSIDPDGAVDAQHNHVAQEEHGGEALWVHRKGALRAQEDEPLLIPGSMGSPTFHARGRGQAESLCSCSHGAGRALSRTAARDQISAAALRQQVSSTVFDGRRAADLVCEAPAAYKDIGAVMRAQRELVAVVRRLRPRLNHRG